MTMPARNRDLSAILPDGNEYEFWEEDCKYAQTLYVDGSNPSSSDDNDGSKNAPFKTINKAAALAQPGTKVLIRGGIYRECVRPAQGGTDPAHMICYEAYPGEEVYVRASDEVTKFEKSTGWRLMPVPEFTDRTKSAFRKAKPSRPGIWKHELDPDMFRGYNPFCAVNIIHDRLFIEYDKTDMTTYLNRRGCVYCDGEPLKQVPLYHMIGEEENTYWVEANGQTVHFRLRGDERSVEDQKAPADPLRPV